MTEAGEGEDGRLKSAIGIGSLLMDGLGDTIRVSLTEDPELEMAPCRHFLLLTVVYKSQCDTSSWLEPSISRIHAATLSLSP